MMCVYLASWWTRPTPDPCMPAPDSLVKIPQISQACRDMAREMEKVRDTHAWLDLVVRLSRHPPFSCTYQSIPCGEYRLDPETVLI